MKKRDEFLENNLKTILENNPGAKEKCKKIFSEAFISFTVNNKSMPSLENALKLCHALDIELEEFFKWQ